MEYMGVNLTSVNEKPSFSHSIYSSSENTDWTDALSRIPWGDIKKKYFECFHEASSIFSLLNMNYQVCNGGIDQYFFNEYDEHIAPRLKNDVAHYDIVHQKRDFHVMVSFAKEVYPERTYDNKALDAAATAFDSLWFERNAYVTETISCEEDEYILDEETGEEILNPDYFDAYETRRIEDIIHGGEEFEDAYYEISDYFEEILELRAQFCAKLLICELEKDTFYSDILEAIKKILPKDRTAEKKIPLNELISSANLRAEKGQITLESKTNKFTFNPQDYDVAKDALLSSKYNAMNWENDGYACKLERYDDENIFYELHLVANPGMTIMYGDVVEVVDTTDNLVIIRNENDEYEKASIEKDFFDKNFVPDRTLEIKKGVEQCRG